VQLMCARHNLEKGDKIVWESLEYLPKPTDWCTARTSRALMPRVNTR
jgi:hypothetical protein